jgi:ABC-type multidrug transport system ATPase subunit
VDPIIKTVNLSKEYRLKHHQRILALNNVNLEVYKGEKLGLLGPNGAGKTTFVSILTTLIQPTTGYAIINGYNILNDPNKVKKNIGLMFGSEMIYYRITGYRNLKFFAKIYEVPDYEQKIKEIARMLELDKWMNEYVERYSTGMKTKLSIARMLLIDPNIFFLDEPTLGLDVPTTNFIIEQLKDLDKTIILCSHDMSIVDKLCDRFAFINHGKIIKEGKKKDLENVFQKGIEILIEIKRNRLELFNKLSMLDFILECHEVKDGLTLILKDRDDYKKLISVLQSYELTKIEEQALSIEDLFLKII